MDYSKHYAALIHRARTREIEGSVELHHVVPRCLGGKDHSKNLVALTPEEHLVAHLLLLKMFPKVLGLVLAAVMMSRDNRNGKRANNKLYGWLRRRAAEAASIQSTGRVVSAETRAKLSVIMKASIAFKESMDQRRGVPQTAEARSKMSISHKTSEAAKEARKIVQKSRIGLKHSDATKAQMSFNRKGRVMPQSQRDKISEALKGKKKSAEHVAKVSAALTGKVGTRTGSRASDETRLKMSIAATGRKMKPEDILKMINNKTPEQRRAAALKAWETKRENQLAV